VKNARRLSLNRKAGDEILNALQQKYPEIQFEIRPGGCEQAVVHVRPRDVTDPVRQAAIRDWLSEWKTNRPIAVKILLRFNAIDFSEGSSDIEL
jgi:hypothetical protein